MVKIKGIIYIVYICMMCRLSEEDMRSGSFFKSFLILVY